MQQQTNLFYISNSPYNRLIRNIWQVSKSECSREKEKILPKGTAEIIFNFSDQMFSFKEREKEKTHFYPCVINGINTTPFHLLKGQQQEFIGIQLHAYALKYLFNIPSCEFTDQVLDGFDVCASLQQLAEVLAGTTLFQERVKLILRWVEKQMKTNHFELERSSIFDLYHSPLREDASVGSMANYCNLSERHLRRLCKEHLGLKAEDFLLYRKYLSALQHLHMPDTSLTQVAYESGFYDQSHFIREFKAFTGLTPGAYRKQMSHLPGHLFVTQ
jgi:AraC-like DNA-binding protein